MTKCEDSHARLVRKDDFMSRRAVAGTRAFPAIATGAQALGALALGAMALGALAIGTMAIGRLAVGRARIKRLEIDELVVRRLRVTEQLSTPPHSDAKEQDRVVRSITA
jgi:hypothetical protein